MNHITEKELRIEFDYQPFEEQILYPIDDAYPGCPEAAMIVSVDVWIGDGWIDILESLSPDAISRLEEECLENL